MIGAGTTVAEPAAGETAWVSAGTYALADRRIRSTTHRVYEAVQAHTGRTALPEADPLYWLDVGPTQMMAPFDTYTSTVSLSATSQTWVITPGYFNALALYAMQGTHLDVSIKDAPGGAVIYSLSQSLLQPVSGYYAWAFVPRRVITKLLLQDLPIRPNAELTITISAGTGEPVGIGMCTLGDLSPLLSNEAPWGGLQWKPTVEPVSYSYVGNNSDGTLKIVPRPSSTNLHLSVQLPLAYADYAVEELQSVLNVPVTWVVPNAPGFQLFEFGIGSGVMSYDNLAEATFAITVTGTIGTT